MKKREEKERLKPGMLLVERKPSKGLRPLYGSEHPTRKAEEQIFMNIRTLGRVLIYIDEKPEANGTEIESEVYCIENGINLFLGKRVLLGSYVRIEECQRKKKKKT